MKPPIEKTADVSWGIERKPEQTANIYVRSDRGDRYAYVSFDSESSNPRLTELARRVHAASYLGEGFVSQAALAPDGTLEYGIDKLRGDGVTYYLGYELGDDEPQACSTLRKMRLGVGDTIEKLPGYEQSRFILPQDVREWLFNIPAERLREIGSFGHIPEVSSKAGLELLRHVLQDSLGKGEVWFFTMVSTNVTRLVKHFGPQAVRMVGAPVKMEDERVNGVQLVPTVVDVDAFFANVLNSIRTETNDARRRHYVLSVLNFAQGLGVDELGEAVYTELEELKMGLGGAHSNASTIDLMASVAATHAEKRTQRTLWTPPLQFDLGQEEGRRMVQELVASGRVKQVLSPALASLGELYGLRNPHDRQAEDELRAYIDTESAKGEALGTWFYYPWREALVQMPSRTDYQFLRTSRNRRLWTPEEQSVLLQPEILIAGMSTGSNVLEQTLHSGVGGAYTLADFDTLDATNLNRIHSSLFDIGEEKTITWARRVSEIDPYIPVTVLQDGIDEATLAGIESAPAIIFDQVDDFVAKALLRQYARRNGVPLLMVSDVGTTALIDVERYDTEAPRPFNGRLSDKMIQKMLSGDLSEHDKMQVTTALIGLGNASFRLLDSVVHKEELGGFPQRGTTASFGAAAATEIAADILLGRPVHSGRRKVAMRTILNLPKDTTVREKVEIAQNYFGLRKAN